MMLGYMLTGFIKTTQRIGESLVGAGTTPNSGKQIPESKLDMIHSSDDYVFFLIKPFRDNDRGVNHWDTIMRNLVSLKRKRIYFWISGNQTTIKLYAKVPKEYISYFQNTFYANYPTSDLILVNSIPASEATHFLQYADDATFVQKAEFTKDGTYMDPISDIFALYQSVPKASSLDICYSYTFGVSMPWRKKLLIFLQDKLSKNKEDEQKNDKNEQTEKKEIYMSIGYSIHHSDEISGKALGQDIRSAFAPFVPNGKIDVKLKEKLHHMQFGQAVNFFHMPTHVNFVKSLDYNVYRKLPYPSNLPTLDNTDTQDLTILGTTDYRVDKVAFGIKKEDKFRHVYIVGKTGTGKSTFMSNMVKSDMHSGNGLALLDPHGDLVETVLEHIPSHRINDVILFDVADTEYPIGFNLLQYESDDEKNRIISGVVATFYKLYAHSWGPRLEYILRNVLLSIVEYPNATLLHILRILVDQNFRQEVVSHITDPLVLKFWQTEFNKWTDKQREEAIAPITNKIGQFLSSNIVRNIFGQPRTKLSLRKAMDEGKIILINLSKGKIGEDNAAMIGSLLVTKFQIDAMSRADIPYHQRKDFYLYIDEFQNFATESFATILSEARKYKLSLIVANQYISQLDDTIKDAIFGNIGTILSFTLGHDDAVVMSAQYKEIVSINDIISLPRFTAYLKLMIDGISSDPFSMKTMPLITPEGSVELRDKILKQSRQRYAIPKSELESLMNAWNKKTFSVQEKVTEKAEMESLGLSEDEATNRQHPQVEANIHLFTDYTIKDQQPDAIIFDIIHKKHKAIWYHPLAAIGEQANFVKNIGNVSIYLDPHLQDGKHEALTILVGDKQDIIDIIKSSKHFLKFVPNVNKLAKKPIKKDYRPIDPHHEVYENGHNMDNTVGFSIHDIVLGQTYQGYVKLVYNYGIFVTVKGVEGLLHKNYITSPAGVDWKKYYNTGDKIAVIAKEFKDIKGEKKVVWAM